MKVFTLVKDEEVMQHWDWQKKNHCLKDDPESPTLPIYQKSTVFYSSLDNHSSFIAIDHPHKQRSIESSFKKQGTKMEVWKRWITDCWLAF